MPIHVLSGMRSSSTSTLQSSKERRKDSRSIPITEFRIGCHDDTPVDTLSCIANPHGDGDGGGDGDGDDDGMRIVMGMGMTAVMVMVMVMVMLW